jgi:hypothetical protein
LIIFRVILAIDSSNRRHPIIIKEIFLCINIFFFLYNFITLRIALLFWFLPFLSLPFLSVP